MPAQEPKEKGEGESYFSLALEKGKEVKQSVLERKNWKKHKKKVDPQS